MPRPRPERHSGEEVPVAAACGVLPAPICCSLPLGPGVCKSASPSIDTPLALCITTRSRALLPRCCSFLVDPALAPSLASGERERTARPRRCLGDAASFSGLLQTAPAPTAASAPGPSSYSPHAMAQAQSQAPPLPLPLPPSANYDPFEASSQRFSFPNPFRSDFPPTAVPATPSSYPPPYPPQPSENATTDDDDAYDPRYPQNILSPRQPDQLAGGSANGQEGDQEQNRTRLADPTVRGDNTSKPSDADSSLSAWPKKAVLPSADAAPRQLLLPTDGRLQQPSASSERTGANALPTSAESHVAPAAAPAQPFQRHYENTTGPELRRLAKGALLSLGHHSIHYADLVKEGIDQRLLASLYDELNISISPLPASERPDRQADEPAVSSSNTAPAVQESALAPAPAPANSATPVPANSVTPVPANSGTPVPANSGTPVPASNSAAPAPANLVTHVPASNSAAPAPANSVAPAPANSVDRPAPAGNPGLERKDRIAQLLAAKTARASPSRVVSDSVSSAAVQSIPHNRPSNTGPVATATAVPAVATPKATEADQQPAAVEAARVDSVEASVAKPATDHVDSSAQIPPQLERRVTDGAALPAQLSSLIPGLFMTSDDPIATAGRPVDTGPVSNTLPSAVQVTPASQKRRRSSDDVDQVAEPESKRQNTASDLDEGEVMAVDSPPDKHGSEAKASSNDENVQPPATRSLEKLANGSRAQLQRSQSASEVPSVAPPAPPNEAAANRPAAARAANAFGKSSVTGMTAAQITERAEMLKARFLRQRAERQKTLQDGLPNLEAEVAKTRTLLAEKQSALSHVDERIQKLKDDISDLTRQRETIGDEMSQLEARLQDGLSGQRRLRDELRKLGVEKNTPSAKGSPAPTPQPPKDSVPEASLPSQGEKRVEAERELAPVAKRASISERMPEERQPLKAQLDDHDGRDRSDYVHTNGTTPYSDVNGAVVGHDSIGDRRRGPAGDDERQDPADPATQQDVEMDDGLSDEYDPEEAPLHPAPSAVPVEDSNVAQDSNVAEDSTVAEDSNMADNSNVDSGGNVTPPAAPEGALGTAGAAGAAGAAGITGAAEDSNVDSTPDDGLSPGEVVESNSDEPSPSADAAPINLPNGSSDVKVSDAGLPAALPATHPATQPTAHPATQPTAHPATHTATHPSTRPSAHPATQPRWVNGSVGSVRPLSNEAPNHTASFTPYQSPLNSLKAFRYNQQLNDPTADGFRSLTYSNTIDLNVPLCPTELGGAECQDPACTEQHFRRFQLTDEQILVQMSKADDIGDQAAKDEFTRGLKELIADLRSRGFKEFEQVATELSKYRRDFFARSQAL
ncbi:hypothetical protein DV737_g3881, partial [Chaetothyriales sp. CBS 132003]